MVQTRNENNHYPKHRNDIYSKHYSLMLIVISPFRFSSKT